MFRCVLAFQKFPTVILKSVNLVKVTVLLIWLTVCCDDDDDDD